MSKKQRRMSEPLKWVIATLLAVISFTMIGIALTLILSVYKSLALLGLALLFAILPVWHFGLKIIPENNKE